MRKEVDHMKKLFYIVPWILCLAWLFCLPFTAVSKESTLITQPAEVITALGSHQHHMFYDIKEETKSPDGQEGEIIQKYGLMGGIEFLDALTATEQGNISFAIDARHGALKLLLEKADTKEVIFYDFLTEEAQELSLEAGEYRIYMVGDQFSGKCQIAYQGMQIAS